MSQSALYFGSVQHTRLRPKRHKLRYSLFNLLLDLDELPELSRRFWLFGVDRPGVVSFYQRDHGAGTGLDLRDWVRQHLRDAGLADDGPIRLLCMPRVFGHCFNPLSVYFCYDIAGHPIAILYQVNNTFGQRHSYLIPIDGEDDNGVIKQDCVKSFYVSPFMDMDLRYQFVVRIVPDSIAVTVNVLDSQGLLLAASFSGMRRSLTDTALAVAIMRAPLLGLKVISAIHWEALKIWRKGIALRPRPAAPAHAVTIVARREA